MTIHELRKLAVSRAESTPKAYRVTYVTIDGLGTPHTLTPDIRFTTLAEAERHAARLLARSYCPVVSVRIDAA